MLQLDATRAIKSDNGRGGGGKRPKMSDMIFELSQNVYI